MSLIKNTKNTKNIKKSGYKDILGDKNLSRLITKVHST